jgi:hypothetical protein
VRWILLLNKAKDISAAVPGKLPLMAGFYGYGQILLDRVCVVESTNIPLADENSYALTVLRSV